MSQGVDSINFKMVLVFLESRYQYISEGEGQVSPLGLDYGLEWRPPVPVA